jgi:hypothetical protein
MATTETSSQMAARFRKMAEDKSLPQSVRNTYLDKANAVEKEAAKPTMAKGGAVMPQRGSRTAKHKETKMNYGGMPMVDGMKMPAMAKGGAVKPMVKKMAKKGK